MIKRLPQLLFALFAMTSLGTLAFADETVPVGQLVIGFAGIEILNDTGTGPAEDGIATSAGAPLTFTVTGFMVDTSIAGWVTFQTPTTDFTSDGLNPQNLDCTGAECNLSGDGKVLEVGKG